MFGNNLRQQKMLILWRLMQKGLICMPMSESLANRLMLSLWLKIIQITMKLPLQFLLIIRILQQVFLPKKED